MNELTIKIVMLLLPGIIVTMLIDKFTEHKEWTNYKYSLFVISYGILSYLILQILSLLNQCAKVGYENFTVNSVEYLHVWEVNSNLGLPYSEVIAASMVSFFLGLFITHIDNKEYLSKLLMTLKITRKYGDYSVYQQILKANENHWMDITIWDKKIIIRGIPVSIHESNGLCELCIYDAQVFNFDDKSANLLYSVNYISISEKYDNLMISTTPDEVQK